ncbi:MAG: glycosyltransferase, partial [Nitrospinaceae bacterium]
MLNGKRICVVMPAYNAEKTLKKTYDEIPKDIVDNVILTDDASTDETVKVSRELDIKTFIHTENKGYGGNQKTCYQAALESGADIVIMLHPDYQYTPKLILPMASM